ncbi:Small auxin-up RNA [Trema orientale]|uniref:Small auxin-up RNA n=1 Tax=Trema orientale TaxID=63057 RepID=A0A2P5D3W8_TREOI|nr:Small auxin-up RNA [Trema orientale]
MRIFIKVKYFLTTCFTTSSVRKQAFRDHSTAKRVFSVPKDVPKGHLAVYVGEEFKRYVINITLLKHPLFQELLDHVEEVFQFANGSRLCIPCSEHVFLSVLQCINVSERARRVSMRRFFRNKQRY